MIDTEDLGRLLAQWKRPDYDQLRIWRAFGFHYTRLAKRILRLAEQNAVKIDLEEAIQEELLDWGWNNPLRDSARLVDGPLAVSQ